MKRLPTIYELERIREHRRKKLIIGYVSAAVLVIVSLILIG